MVALGALGARAWFADERQFNRKMLALPLTEISKAPEEEDLRIRGVLSYKDGVETLRSPFTKRQCAAWRVIAEHKDGGRWVEVAHDARAVEFVLSDESGRAIVEPSKSTTLALHVDAKGEQGPFSGTSPRLLAFCKERGIRTERFDSYRTLRVWEGILEAGETVCVGGSGRFENDPNPRLGYRGSSRRLRLGPLSNDELWVSDEAVFAKDAG